MEPALPKVILALGGAFNPVHTQHVAILNFAKQYLEEKFGYQVIAGYLACAPDGYVRGKLRENAMKAEHRLAMCKLAAADSPWILPCTRTYSSAFECCQAVAKDSNERLVMGVVVGADRATTKSGGFKAKKPKNDLITICVGRPGTTEKIRASVQTLEPDFRKSFFLVEKEALDVSSTKIRKLLEDMRKDVVSKEETILKLIEGNYESKETAEYLISNIGILYLLPKAS